ncbi:MAG: hypothetical protein DMG19_17415 [Acidobacteria bacterium]|nr:MAG: hypothetical protein DMG19_17415 [Acidobacteriota bacterium]
MKASSLRDIILTLAASGLEIFERTTGRRQEDIVAMCRRLVHLKGEASAVANLMTRKMEWMTPNPFDVRTAVVLGCYH